ncbi:MAG: GntR family transcriptional regulator [Deltaproteobacteria bacterium]|nr:GntR family transcriptional regulator [Deltaproteobacteria bacterium]
MVGEKPLIESIAIPSSLKEIAFQAIKKAIVSGTLKPGNLYSEPVLAKQLGISRTPVREALLDIASRGFVEYVRNKGFRVKVLTKVDIRHLSAFRRGLEATAIREIMPCLTDATLKEMEAIHGRDMQASRAKNWDAFVKVDREFHIYLCSLSENPYLISAMERVRDLIDWACYLMANPSQRFSEALREHELIFEKLKERDLEGALMMMEGHLNITETRIIDGLAFPGPEKSETS